MTLRERSGKRSGSAAFAATRNCSRALESGSSGSVEPCSAASSTIRSQRLGVRTTRRSDGKLFGREVARGHAVGGDHEVLDDLLGPVLRVGFQVLELVAVEDRTRFDGFEVERAVLVPERLQLLGHAVLEPEVLVQAADRADRRRHRPAALQPGGHAVVGELGAIAHRRADRRPSSAAIRPRREPSRRRWPGGPTS